MLISFALFAIINSFVTYQWSSVLVFFRDRIAIAVVVVAAVVVLVSVFSRSLVGVSFIPFRDFLGRSESKFFFELDFVPDFVAKDYFKINLSFVRC